MSRFDTRCVACKTERSPGHSMPAPAPASLAGPARRQISAPLRRWATFGSCTYMALVAGLCLLMKSGGDRWWPVTFLLYGPRWPWALPLLLLVPMAVMVRPGLLSLLVPASALVLGPLMGLCIPWSRPFAGPPARPALRVLTCNTHGAHLDSEALGQLVASIRPDIVSLQEWSGRNESAVFGRGGWHVRTSDSLCLASRYPIRGVETLFTCRTGGGGAGGDAARFDLETPGGIIHVFNLHLATPREGLKAVLSGGLHRVPVLRAHFARRWEQSKATSDWVSQTSDPVLLTGDLNQPSDSAIFRRFWSRYPDAFSSSGLGFGYTKLTRWYGIRIDHILAGPGWRFCRCWIGPDIGSDHLPVIADVEPLDARD